MVSYFSGTRSYDPIIVPNGSTSVCCTVSEYWTNMDQDIVVMCGATETCEIERTSGFQRKEYRSLDATITSSLGVQALASLGGQLREQVGAEITLSEAVTRTSKQEITAPPCGSTTYIFYQLIRIFEFKIPRPRPWPFNPTVSIRTFREQTKNYAVRAERIEFDPMCGCTGEPRAQVLKLVDMILGNLKVRTDAELLSNGSLVAWLGDTAISIPNGGAADVEVLIEQVPPILLDLADVQAEGETLTLQLIWPPSEETIVPELFDIAETYTVATSA